ncbi:MAG: Sir2 family NAD-dependent protein deacetylase [Eubacterium sp.]
MNVVALTGAGVSKASGVPTFVEMGDLREKLSRDFYDAHPAEFFEVVLGMKDIADKAEPNPAHLALAKYHVPIITMNIDGLHHRAGSTEDEVIEIHGSMRKVFCDRCGAWFDFDVIRDSIYCPHCKDHILQPDIVLYGDNIPRLTAALKLVAKADQLVVIGTSFYTSTASYVTDEAKRWGIPVEIINDHSEEILPKYLDKIYGGH